MQITSYNIQIVSFINNLSFPFIIVLNFIDEQLAQRNHKWPGRVKVSQTGLGSMLFSITQLSLLLLCKSGRGGKVSPVLGRLPESMPCSTSQLA